MGRMREGIADVHQHTVLVVDDDLQVRRLFADSLEPMGTTVRAAGSVDAAVAVARADPDVCVVLADVRMPGKDGWDLQRELRHVNPELPVVLLTADRLLSIRGTVLDKPIAADDIAALIRRACPHGRHAT
jgi:two-component system, NtrC family, C4-dicarboxylate transport response regulator DctD